jgi:hypothetical protein
MLGRYWGAKGHATGEPLDVWPVDQLIGDAELGRHVQGL